MSAPRCRRCHRRATHAIALDGLVLVLCPRHAAELAERLEREPRVAVGGRTVRVEPPRVEGGRP